MKEDIIVFVYFDNKLKFYKYFDCINSAHIYCKKNVNLGYYCELQRFDNGRPWAKLAFRPKESI